MHTRRLAVFLLGVWIAGSVLVLLITAHNSRAADDLLASPSPAAVRVLKTFGTDSTLLLLRFEAAELTRWYITSWETIQLGLGLVLMAVLIRAFRGIKPSMSIVALMLVTVFIMRFYMTPQINELGRAVDFLAEWQPSPDRERLANLVQAHSVFEIGKTALGLALLATLLYRSRRGAGSRSGQTAD